MTGREAKRLALLSIVGWAEVQLGTLNEDDLAHPETDRGLSAEDARTVRRAAEELLETMGRRAARLRSLRSGV